MTTLEAIGTLKCLQYDLKQAVTGEKDSPIVCVIRERIEAIGYAILKLEEIGNE